jgi:hypothetical protein
MTMAVRGQGVRLIAKLVEAIVTEHLDLARQ